MQEDVTISGPTVSERLDKLTQKIEKACKASGRKLSEVKLVAVTKTLPISKIEDGIQAGLSVFGENYIQEARKKISLIDADVSWHFIGRLQSNKAKYAAPLFDLIHSVDSLKLAGELNRRAAAIPRTVSILIQANLSGETTKAGLNADGVKELIDEVQAFDHIELKGLMTMPPAFGDPEGARQYFAALRKLKDDIGEPLKELSMGMSGDFEVAIEEGATIIRIGTDIFGPRG